MQTLGGNFKVNGQLTLEGIGFFGYYYADNNAFADQFTVEVRGDTGAGLGPRSPGVPGAVIETLGGVPSRAATGNLLWGVITEYEYSLTAAVPLQRGKYWLTIFNDSSSVGGVSDWFWLTGTPMPRAAALPP